MPAAKKVLEHNRELLADVAAGHAASSRRRAEAAQRKYCQSKDAKDVAGYRARKSFHLDRRPRLSLVLETARRVSVWRPCDERVVLRLLDQSSVLAGIKDLGLEPDDEERLFRIIDQPYGMVLVTGPTGSGKTTTLYSCLNEMDVMTESIVTLEDPVEYQIPGVIQIQVKPQIGLTFASGLRSIVRQDPDVILVGEIRDRETAEIAIHSALTGHMVLSTLHTNDAPGAVTRLLEMGVEEYLLPSCLVGILAQRLAKEAVSRAYETTLTAGLDVERKLFHLAHSTEDAKEGLAAFGEKRKPEFKGR